MPDEFDPVAELGLFPEKNFICSCRGFITKNNSMRDLCARFIRNGERFYDAFRRYDDLVCYVLGREEASSGNRGKWIVPFLKANGATDHSLMEASRASLQIMPGADAAMRYVSQLMPTFIATTLYDHTMMPVMEALDAPLVGMSCTEMEMDTTNLGRTEARRLREVAQEIASLKVPKTEYKLNVPMELDGHDVEIIRTIDRILEEEIPGTACHTLMESVGAMTSNRKAYNLLDIRRQTNIDLDCTMYMGSSRTDFQSMDLVKDSGGLSVAFNGTDYAVRGCNIAILSNDATVGAVFAEEYYNGGIQSALDLAANWERKYLKNLDFSDRHLLSTMLAAHPRKLPEVYVVDRGNEEEVADRSDSYRKKLLGPRHVPDNLPGDRRRAPHHDIPGALHRRDAHRPRRRAHPHGPRPRGYDPNAPHPCRPRGHRLRHRVPLPPRPLLRFPVRHRGHDPRRMGEARGGLRLPHRDGGQGRARPLHVTLPPQSSGEARAANTGRDPRHRRAQGRDQESGPQRPHQCGVRVRHP
jgi:predicted HAD superfamily phosphohydrolase